MKRERKIFTSHSNLAVKRDDLFSKPLDKIKEFEFNDKVAGVFDDMISESEKLTAHDPLESGLTDNS